MQSNIKAIWLLRNGSQVVVANMLNREITYPISCLQPPKDVHLQIMRSQGKAYIDKMKDFFPVMILSERTKQVSDLYFIEREDCSR